MLYGEIKSDLKKNDTVQQGDLVGIMQLSSDGTLMLHLEVYEGDFDGYKRDDPNRVDPTFTYDLADSEPIFPEVKIPQMPNNSFIYGSRKR